MNQQNVRSFGDLIDLHVADMEEVGRPPRRSKAASLRALKARLGNTPIEDLRREDLIAFGRARASNGAGPVLEEARALCPVSVDVVPVTLKEIFLETVREEED